MAAERASPLAIPIFSPRNPGSDGRIWGPAGLVGAILPALALAVALFAHRPRPSRPPLPDVSETLAKLDDVQARAIVAQSLPSECDRALTDARRAQHGALVFVKGDHCHVVRSLRSSRK